MSKYRLKIVESERGWGQNYEKWPIAATTLEEAKTRMNEINAENKAGPVPDYYIQCEGIQKYDEETNTWFNVK